MQQHPSQPYQGQAPSRQIQQSPILSNSTSGQPPFPVQSAYAHHSAIQSPYLSSQNQFGQQQSQQTASENVYYNSNPSPRSSNGANYYSTDKSEHMAAATTMQRPYPPIYHTPQSHNSPASVTSPQTHDHGRPIYAQQSGQMSQPMYPYTYSPLTQLQTSYSSHNQPGMPPTQILPNYHNASPMSHPASAHTPLNTSPRIKPDPQAFSQTPRQGSLMHQQHSTPGPTPGSASSAPSQQQGPTTGSSAAPGPIPATTPLVVRQDNNGVQWIAFEYSRDRVKMEYTIRCDVESVDTNSLAQDFKSENCVYPRACVPRDQYKGNRLNYESDCNQVGWALAELNPCLRGKRGLIQRAVDSWRNSNQDPRLRSRRVRRQAKMTSKNRPSGSGSGHPAASASTGITGPNSMPAPNGRSNTNSSTGAQIHHHGHSEMSPTTQDPLQASGYSNNQATHRTSSISEQLSSPNELRHSQTFPVFQSYPNVTSSMNSSMAPPISGNIHQYGRPGGNSVMTSNRKRGRDEEDSELFGDLPEGKKRKFILVDDSQKATRVRVKVTLDQVNVQDIPDSYRRQNSVYPRSYYPIQMQSEPPAGRFSIAHNDTDEAAPTAGNMTVPVTTTDGENQVDVSQLTVGKKNRERKINELGYRMAWGQGRVFSNRPIFLARALDAYRTKQRMALIGTSQEPVAVPVHLEVRPGKQRWLDRTRPGKSNSHSPLPKKPEES